VPIADNVLRLPATVLLAGTMLAAVVLAPATPALAAGPATAAPMLWELPGTDKVTDVLAVGPEVWISAGNAIVIASPTTGQVRKTVTGVFGAKGLTLSPDAASVYVSSSTAAKIMQVSTAGDIIHTWDSQGCPGKSAVAGGALYYAYDCTGSTGVGRIDLATGADRSVLTDPFAQSLTATGTTLVTYDNTSSPSPMTSYAIGTDGSLTRNSSVRPAQVRDAEISPDGNHVVITDYGNGYGVARYNATTLAPEGTFSTGAYPEAVAWSPDGTRFAGLLDAYYDTSPVHVFSAQDGTEVTKSLAAGYTSYGSRAHEAAWSADGRYIYSLSQETEKAYLVVTPTAGQVQRPFTVTVAQPTAYGKNVTVTVRAANRPNTAVRLAVTMAGKETVRTLRTNSSGIATLALHGLGSGTATATAPANLAYLAASASARVTTPSAVAGRLTGFSRTSKGVAHYRSAAAVHADIQILPRRRGKVVISLQHRSGTTWKLDQTKTFDTAADGTTWVGLSKGGKKVLFRFVAGTAGDSFAGASPKVYSQPFVLD
jgi:hypothetical protein